MTFDPKTDEPADSSKREKKVKNMYEKLLARGATGEAEALRDAGTLHDQVNYIGQQVAAFDPEHDDDLNTSAKIAVKNIYDALRELGHDDLAEELRTYTTTSAQNRRARSIVDEIDDAIDPVTGEVVPAESVEV